MNIFLVFIEAYLIALVILIHMSLLLCEKDNCITDPSIYFTLPAGFRKILINMFNLIPIRLEIIQLISHFFLIGDVVLIAILIFNLIKSTFKMILFIAVISLAVLFGLYFASVYLQGE